MFIDRDMRGVADRGGRYSARCSIRDLLRRDWENAIWN
jgi:hypothetical protein